MNRAVNQDQVLRDLLRLLRRQRLLILAFVLVAVAAAVAYSVLQTPVYEASADVQFNDQSQDLGALGTPVVPPSDPGVQAAADAEIITSNAVLQGVRRSVNHGLSVDEDLSLDQVRDSVDSEVDPASNLVTIRTTAGDADLAARLANAFAVQTRDVATNAQRTRLEGAADSLQKSIRDQKPRSATRALAIQRISQLRSLATFGRPVLIASPARTPDGPTSPKPVRDTILAFFLGLIFGILAAFLRDSLDRRLTETHDVEHHLQFPIVGYVGATTLGTAVFSRNGSDASSQNIEEFRILRSNVDFLAPGRAIRSLAITSPVAEEGKSTVSAGLATAATLAGKRVLLIECDLRRPVVAKRFKLEERPGLTDLLQGTVEPAVVIRKVPADSYVSQDLGRATQGDLAEQDPTRLMSVVVAGSWSPRPAELLGSARFRAFLEEAQQRYDLVVLDCAPLLPVGDALEVIPQAEGVLVCIRLDQTTQEQARAAKAVVEHFPPRPTGVVVTGVRSGREGYYYGYYSSHSAA